MNKIYNFSAGPAVLNQSVLKAMSEALSSDSENMNFELNKVIEGLGEMTKGNIQMINNYLNPNTTPEKPERKRRRRRRGA